MASSALIDDLLKQFAENPRRVFARLANEYRKRGELDTAIEICRAHVPLQPTYISGYIVLGQALYETGQLDEARSTFETALGLDPENLIGLRQLGDIARAKGDLSGARAWYKRLLEVDPQNDDVEAVLREIEAPAAPAPAAPAPEAVSWNDIHPEAPVAPRPAAAVAPSAPAAPASEPPAAKALDFDYDVLSAFGDAGSAPAGEHPAGEHPAAAEAMHEEPAPMASESRASRTGPAPVIIPAPAPVEERGSSSDEPLPAAFITETMAELYLQQGHRDQALDIYRLLLAQRPGDVSLLSRIAKLQQAAPAAALERTVRAFFGRFANRRPPGMHAEADAAPAMAADAPTSVNAAPYTETASASSPLGRDEGGAREEASPLGFESRGDDRETAGAAPEPMAFESSEMWTSLDRSVAEPPAPADPMPEEPESQAAAEPATPAAEEDAGFREPSIADFAPAELEAEAERQPEPVAAQPDEVHAFEEPPAPGEMAAPNDLAAPNEMAAPNESAASNELAAPNESAAPNQWVAPNDLPASNELAVAHEAPAPDEAGAPSDPAGEPVRVGDYTPQYDRTPSFAELFAGRPASDADERAAAALASAYGSESGVTNGAGQPARAAADALSLDDVFGGGAHEHDSAPVTFDQFFSRDAGHAESATESGTHQPSAPVAARRADDADLELFHQWLEGLKK